MPVGIHPFIERFPVKELCRPFRRMDFSDLRRHHQPGDFEQLVRLYLIIQHRLVRFRRMPQSAIALTGLLPERIDKRVVFTGKHVV